ncbi:hypothetical protein CEXT_624781 [Caerostris extrusa]|uniref:Uncharacterized protein n=1 Tax=Caerostris extrusa TaxID=172846 RepID=A0AAV4Y1M2_CAEEX|nr:hypothetical protein CEXT_624781 [Caerostris extrusa]
MLNGWFIAQKIPAGMEVARSKKHAKTLMAIRWGDLSELGTVPSECFSTNEFLLNFYLGAAFGLCVVPKGVLGIKAISSGNEMIWAIKSDLLSYDGAWKGLDSRSLFRGRCGQLSTWFLILATWF